MMGNRDRLKHTLENELSRTLAEVLFPSLFELNQSFHRFLDSVNDLRQLMMKSEKSRLHPSSDTLAVSQFLYIYQQKINIGLPWLNKAERARWNPVRIHTLLLSIQLTGKIDPVLNQHLWNAQSTKRSPFPSPPYLLRSVYSPSKTQDHNKEEGGEMFV
ncbi:hypothetical protein M4D81_09645 [Paenibacillus sp. p3-SID867]|uniref:hypothetical protein n=1 Tax=Paenibacillus sp. p3-SID867 TaxID=2916363 RepID=UPI0021A71A0C|nr:hypothetical protein [Paenibacillus sp. p3-SID867]MCT1399280.1 hypothetical protein [Paenibacillus sp. p3-SID867]